MKTITLEGHSFLPGEVLSITPLFDENTGTLSGHSVRTPSGTVLLSRRESGIKLIKFCQKHS